MKNFKIIGTGSYIPDNVVTNENLEGLVDTSNQWIIERTGISERRISKDEDTSIIASKAALKAIESSGINPEDIELIIVGTVSPDSLVPSVACNVQKAIGASNAMAFDINAACSGFMFGLSIVENFIATGSAKTALIIGAEVLSKIIDWKDRGTCILFGDGAGAVVVTRSEEQGICSINCKSVGAKGESLTCGGVDLENPYANKISYNSKINMNGKEIYKFAVRVMEQEFNRILKEQSLTKEEIDFIIPHQANLRMIESFSKKTNIAMEKFIINLDRVGNTSAASIPIALDEAAKNNRFRNQDKIMIIGFGGGLTFGSGLIIWSI